MTTQNYCLINTENICDNVVLWDGNPDTWQPPSGYLTLVQETTPSKVWALNQSRTAYILIDTVGDGTIGFTWDGTFLVTNDPQPVVENNASNEPISSGTQTL